MNLILFISIAVNVILLLIIRSFIKENQRLIAKKPVLNLEKFEKVHDDHIAAYGDGASEIIIRTCLATAHALDAEVTIHDDMHNEIGACRGYIMNYVARIKEAEFNLETKLKQTRNSYEANIKRMRAEEERDRERIRKIEDLHHRI